MYTYGRGINIKHGDVCLATNYRARFQPGDEEPSSIERGIIYLPAPRARSGSQCCHIWLMLYEYWWCVLYCGYLSCGSQLDVQAGRGMVALHIRQTAATSVAPCRWGPRRLCSSLEYCCSGRCLSVPNVPDRWNCVARPDVVVVEDVCVSRTPLTGGAV